MGAPKGNQFWKLRSKHGRDKLFASPQLLWEAACEYFKWCDENPLIQNDFIKSGPNAGDKVEVEKVRVYMLKGLALYLNCSAEYIRNFQQNNKDAKDFMSVLTCIEDTIFTQKFTGAASDLFNANLMSRDLGLVDKKQQEIKGEQPLFPKEGE